MVALAGIALAIGFLCCPETHAAGASPWEAVSLSVGLQERWLTNNAPVPDGRELEAFGQGALSLTPHVSVVGQAAVGLQNSYVRGAAGARITASDATNPDFNVFLEVGRHFSKRPSDGLDEWAGTGGIGWRPIKGKADEYGAYAPNPIVLGLRASYGFDSSARALYLVGAYNFKRIGGSR